MAALAMDALVMDALVMDVPAMDAHNALFSEQRPTAVSNHLISFYRDGQSGEGLGFL